mgnify:FL=1
MTLATKVLLANHGVAVRPSLLAGSRVVKLCSGAAISLTLALENFFENDRIERHLSIVTTNSHGLFYHWRS